MSTNNNPAGTPKTMRAIFGIVMIIVYIGVGILFLTGFFAPIYGSWEWIRWVGGIIFIVYESGVPTGSLPESTRRIDATDLIQSV